MLALGTATFAGMWDTMCPMARSNIHTVSYNKQFAPQRIETAAS